MKNYEDYLGYNLQEPKEGELLRGVSKRSFSSKSIVLTVATIFLFSRVIPLIVIGILLFIHTWVNIRNTRYFITSHRIIARVIGFDSIEFDIFLDDVKNVEMKQSFIGKKLNYGTILIHRVAINKPLRLKYVLNPLDFIKNIENELNESNNQYY